jgi:hypothetical protein
MGRVGVPYENLSSYYIIILYNKHLFDIETNFKGTIIISLLQ